MFVDIFFTILLHQYFFLFFLHGIFASFTPIVFSFFTRKFSFVYSNIFVFRLAHLFYTEMLVLLHQYFFFFYTDFFIRFYYYFSLTSSLNQTKVVMQLMQRKKW